MALGAVYSDCYCIPPRLEEGAWSRLADQNPKCSPNLHNSVMYTQILPPLHREATEVQRGVSNLLKAPREEGERVDLKAGGLTSEAMLLTNGIQVSPLPPHRPTPSAEAGPAPAAFHSLSSLAKWPLKRTEGSMGV